MFEFSSELWIGELGLTLGKPLAWQNIMVRSPGEGGQDRCERGMYWLMANLSCGGTIAEHEPRGNSRIWEAEIVCGMMLKSDMMGDILLVLRENISLWPSVQGKKLVWR